MPTYLTGKVEALDRRDAVFVEPVTTLRAAAHAMWVENVGALVVADGSGPVGIVSERDLVSQVAQGVDLDVATVADAMTPHLIPARVGDTVGDAAYQMLEGSIRHLPLVDGGGHVVGMVSVRDLLRPLLVDAPVRPG
jgi:CBS domain-containing protein